MQQSVFRTSSRRVERVFFNNLNLKDTYDRSVNVVDREGVIVNCGEATVSVLHRENLSDDRLGDARIASMAEVIRMS